MLERLNPKRMGFAVLWPLLFRLAIEVVKMFLPKLIDRIKSDQAAGRETVITDADIRQFMTDNEPKIKAAYYKGE